MGPWSLGSSCGGFGCLACVLFDGGRGVTPLLGSPAVLKYWVGMPNGVRSCVQNLDSRFLSPGSDRSDTCELTRR